MAVSSENQASELVDKLYEFRDNYVANQGLEHILEKTSQVKKKMNETVSSLAGLEVTCSKTFYLLQLGRALNVMPDYSQECEEYLSKVVKRNPSIIEGWNILGENFWKKGDITAAKDCFEGALKRSKDKVSLRSLSMVLRQIKPIKTGDTEKLVIQSVEYAKQAVEMDLNDGTSWYILGNAYLSLFFTTEQNEKVLRSSLKAYSEAENVDKSSKHNPDLHFNRSQAYRFEEEFLLALKGWETASSLDPTWVEPRNKSRDLIKYLDRVNELVEKRGKMKGKKLQTLIKSITNSDLGPYADGSYTLNKKTVVLKNCPLSQLKPGQNHEKVLLGRVICSMADVSVVPFTIAIVDSEGNPCAVTLYNLAQGKGMIIGDSVAIPEPFLTHQELTWGRDEQVKTWKFCSIRVSNPVVLVVNGKKLTNEHLGFVTASLSVNEH